MALRGVFSTLHKESATTSIGIPMTVFLSLFTHAYLKKAENARRDDAIRDIFGMKSEEVSDFFPITQLLSVFLFPFPGGVNSRKTST